MLRDAVDGVKKDAVNKAQKGEADPGCLLKAERILNEGVDRVVAADQGGDPASRALPDQLRVQTLECLAAMTAE